MGKACTWCWWTWPTHENTVNTVLSAIKSWAHLALNKKVWSQSNEAEIGNGKTITRAAGKYTVARSCIPTHAQKHKLSLFSGESAASGLKEKFRVASVNTVWIRLQTVLEMRFIKFTEDAGRNPHEAKRNGLCETYRIKYAIFSKDNSRLESEKYRAVNAMHYTTGYCHPKYRHTTKRLWKLERKGEYKRK